MSDPLYYRAPMADLPLFADPPAKQPLPAHLRGLARNPDRATSLIAAEKATSTRERMKAMVFQAFQEHGELTDGELELLPQFDGMAINSVRKRRTDLLQDGSLEPAGYRRGHPERPTSMMTVFRIAGKRAP